MPTIALTGLCRVRGAGGFAVHRAWVCRLCFQPHQGPGMDFPPRDEYGQPQLCYGCVDSRLGRKMDAFGECPRSRKARERWFDLTSLGAVAHLFLVERAARLGAERVLI